MKRYAPALFLAAILCMAGHTPASAAGPAPGAGAKKSPDIKSAIAGQVAAGKPLQDIIKPGAFNNAPIDDILPAAINAGASPEQVVYIAFITGFPARSVVTAAVKADVPLDIVVNAAIAAGVDKKTIYEAAIDAGVWPGAVANALAASTSTPPVFESVFPRRPVPALFSAPAPAILGWGGVELRPLPEWKEGVRLIGPLKFNPFLSVMETFSDNVFYTSSDQKKDSITRVMPGVRLQLPFGSQFAEASYYSAITRYRKYTEENITDHHAKAAIDLRAGDHVEFRLFDAYDRDHEPRSSSISGAVEKFDSNAASAEASLIFMRDIRVQAGYAQNAWQFKTSDFRDRDENAVSGRIFYQLIPKSAVFIEYVHQEIAYRDTALGLDGSDEIMQAGLTWDLSARSKGTIKGGVARRDFTSSDRSALNVKTATVDIRHEFTADTSVVLTGQRSLNEPNLPGMSHFITTGGYAELSQRIVWRLAAAVRGAYGEDKYFFLDGSHRTDWSGVAGGGLKFTAAKWLEFAVDYNYHNRRSTMPGVEYIEHSTMITATASL